MNERGFPQETMITTAALMFSVATSIDRKVEIPFRLAETAIIIDVEVNGVTVPTMFDTGFSGTLVLNDTVRVGEPSGTLMLRDFVGQFQAQTVSVNSFKMGGHSFNTAGLEIVQQPASNYTLAYGMTCDGILGMAPFANYVMEINFERSMLILHPQSFDLTTLPVDNERTFRTRLLPIGVNSLELSVRTPDGGRMILALDTGNSFYATTHREVLEDLGLWPRGETPRYMGTSWVASGPVNSWNIRLNDLNIYGVPVEEATWNIIDLPKSSAEKDGTVGFGFLKHFNIIIDQQRRYVYMDNFTGRRFDGDEAHTGLYAVYDPQTDRMRIIRVMPESPAYMAGIRQGDDLLSVDGRELRRFSFNDLNRMMTGEPGTSVTVSTSRAGAFQRHTLERRVLVNQGLSSRNN